VFLPAYPAIATFFLFLFRSGKISSLRAEKSYVQGSIANKEKTNLIKIESNNRISCFAYHVSTAGQDQEEPDLQEMEADKKEKKEKKATDIWDNYEKTLSVLNTVLSESKNSVCFFFFLLLHVLSSL
jgi:hypothetical protein